MNSKVFVFVALLSIANAFVIIGPQSYSSKIASRTYLPPAPHTISKSSAVNTVHIPSTYGHTVHHDVHSHDTVIAGPSGVIKTNSVKTRPAAIVSHDAPQVVRTAVVAHPAVQTEVVSHPVVHQVVRTPVVRYEAPLVYSHQQPFYAAPFYNQPYAGTVGSYYFH